MSGVYQGELSYPEGCPGTRITTQLFSFSVSSSSVFEPP